jgi:hypothetical protein
MRAASPSVEETRMKPHLSVVIPTIGRGPRWHATLQAFAALDPATPHFEVIVVLDGVDPLAEAVSEGGHPFPVSVLAQPRLLPTEGCSIPVPSPWGRGLGACPSKRVRSRYERRGARCKAPRRRRCGAIGEERQRRRWPRAAVTLRAQGCRGRMRRGAGGPVVRPRRRRCSGIDFLLAPCLRLASPLRATRPITRTGS